MADLESPLVRSSTPGLAERVWRLVLVVALGLAALLPVYGSSRRPVTALYMNLAWAWFAISEPMRGPRPAVLAYGFRLAVVVFLLSLPLLALLNLILAFWAPQRLRLSYFVLLTLLWLANLGFLPFLIFSVNARYGSFGVGSIEDPIVVTIAWIVELVLLVRRARQSTSLPSAY